MAQDLGELRRIQVGHTGWGFNSRWLVERIEITKITKKPDGKEERDNKTYRFMNREHKWIEGGHSPPLLLFPDPQVSPRPSTPCSASSAQMLLPIRFSSSHIICMTRFLVGAHR